MDSDEEAPAEEKRHSTGERGVGQGERQPITTHNDDNARREQKTRRDRAEQHATWNAKEKFSSGALKLKPS